MDLIELCEEIRSLLREVQVNKVDLPQHYSNDDLVPQIRSALRYLRTVMGTVNVQGAMDATGTFTEAPTEMEGVMIGYFVADRLVSGDLLQKLQEGELGVVFKTGSDMIDTKTASISFDGFSKRCREKFDELLAIAMAGLGDGSESVLSSQTVQSDEGEV